MCWILLPRRIGWWHLLIMNLKVVIPDVSVAYTKVIYGNLARS